MGPPIVDNTAFNQIVSDLDVGKINANVEKKTITDYNLTEVNQIKEEKVPLYEMNFIHDSSNIGRIFPSTQGQIPQKKESNAYPLFEDLNDYGANINKNTLYKEGFYPK